MAGKLIRRNRSPVRVLVMGGEQAPTDLLSMAPRYEDCGD